MTPSKQQARENMRRNLYAVIRHNLFWHGGTLARHEVVEILASILSGQLELIRDDARKQRNE
ncbi:MAG: hypothetical protein AAB654_02885 [Acidobacteriota bacterium]